METVDAARAKYGLKPLGELRSAGALKDILTQQKEETVDALSVVARPVEVRRCLRALHATEVRSVLARRTRRLQPCRDPGGGFCA